MAEKLKAGDPVEWQTSQGKTTGKVKKKLTKPIEIKGHHVAAAPENPEYLVVSDKSGEEAAHKPAALKKRSAGSNGSKTTAKRTTRKTNDDEGKDAEDERKTTIREFKAAVNMTPKQLEIWLDKDESKAVGQKKTKGSESTGHQSGKQIVTLLRKKQAEYTDDDLDHMRRVISYVGRHSAQRPEGDVAETPWRYSLMNWGHDPLKG